MDALCLDGCVMELAQSFYFEAAHTLDREFDREPSLRIHGHTYHAEIAVVGVPGETRGMVMDLAQLLQVTNKLKGLLDHRLLDHVEGLGPATLENLCRYLAQKAYDEVSASLARVSVWREASGDRCSLNIPVRGGK